MLIAIVLLVSTTASGYFISKKVDLRLSARAPQSVKVKHGTVEGDPFKETEGAMQLCYDDLLTRSPDHDEGQVLYHMMFGESGEISHLELVSSDFKEERFHDCLTDTIKSQHVSPSRDRIGIMIAHHFKFHRKDQAQLVFDQ